MLAEEGVGDEILVAVLDEDSLGGEMEEETAVDADSGGVDHEKTASAVAGIEEDVSESDILVVDYVVLSFDDREMIINGGCVEFLRIW